MAKDRTRSQDREIFTYLFIQEKEMKKIVVLLAVVALAAPAFAQDVEINLSTRVVGPQIFVDVNYDATAAGQLVRGFSFDVEVDNGAGILAVEGYKGQGDPTDVMSSSDPGKTVGYGIYLGTMTFDVTDPLNPLITAEGSPVANGPDSLSGGLLGASIPGITVECGSLYDPTVPVDAPTAAGTLFTVEVNKLVTAMTLTADEDTRGGIVMEDGTVANLVCPTFMVAWGITGFCNGDGNGDGVVDGIDFIKIRDAFLKKYPADYDGTTAIGKYNPSGDYNMDGVVDGIDFIRLRDNFLAAPPDNCTVNAWPPVI